ncbi:MAG: hypothetical protein ACR2KB_03390 [Chitinophagaceae bacterium]
MLLAIAIAARLAKTFQEYVLRMVVQKFGKNVFDNGLKQTLCLAYQEFEEQKRKVIFRDIFKKFFLRF